MGEVIRQVYRQRVFWSAVVLTLTIGTSATTAVFAIVNGILLRPLAYPASDRLVSGEGFGYTGEYLQLRERSRTLAVGAFSLPSPVSVTGLGEPLRVDATRVDHSYFEVLRLVLPLGRPLGPEDVKAGALPVAIMSDGLWRDRFAANRAIVGSTINVDGAPHVVVGVMPDGTQLPERSALWLPLTINPADRVTLWSTSARVVGRLNGSSSVADAQRELRALIPEFRGLFPWRMPADYGASARFVPLREVVVGDLAPTLVAVGGAVAGVLLILCANVATLLLSRGAARERELAIRAALGATRTRLIRQLVGESLVASTFASVLGLVMAAALLKLVVPFLPADLPRLDDITLDARVLLFSVLLSFTTALFFGSLPAWRGAAAARDFSLLRTAGAGTLRPSERRSGRLLAIGEFALAAMLVLTSATLARHLWQLLDVRPGFNPDRLTVASIAPQRFRYVDAGARRRFADDLVARLGSAPGVRSAALASVVPFAGPTYGSVFSIEGRPDPARQTGEWPGADVRAVVTPGYFDTLGIRLFEGRLFVDSDAVGAEGVAVVSRSLARRYWPESSALNARIRFPGPQGRWLTIVGVVDDVKWHSLGEEDGQFPSGRRPFLSALYVPLGQSDADTLRPIVRSEGDPGAVGSMLRALVREVDSEAPISNIATMSAQIAASAARPRFIAGVLSAFAGVALLLAAIGVYGVLAYAVRRRTMEFATRSAVGASAQAILLLVLSEGARLTLIGLAIGVVGAVASTRGVEAVVPVTDGPLDPAQVALVLSVLMATGLVASYVPAWRAMRISPALAMRSE